MWISRVMIAKGGFSHNNNLWLKQKCYQHIPDRQKSNFFYSHVINMAVKRLSPINHECCDHERWIRSINSLTVSCNDGSRFISFVIFSQACITVV